MSHSKNSIKLWPKEERPREILLDKGAEYLSDAGLVAILLRTGVQGKDAVALARDLIKHFGSLGGLLSATKEDLHAVKGLGQAKIAQLMAVFEIAKRALKEEIAGKNYIRHKEDVLRYLSLAMRDLKREFFKVIFLDQSHGIIKVEDLFKGTLNGAAVYPREVVKRALEVNAAAVILVHNHPGGNPVPSRQDHDLTRRLTQSLQSVEIAVLDHLIISSGGVSSVLE
jgi:DNA repair protein RadC